MVPTVFAHILLVRCLDALQPAERARVAPGGMNHSFCSPAPLETLSAGAQGFKSPLPHRSHKLWFCDLLQPPPNARGAGRRSTPLTSLPPSAGCYQPSHQAIN